MGVEVRKIGAIAWLTLNRPDVRNALDMDSLKAISAFADDLASDPELRVGVIAGAGDYFCAGADLAEFLASLDSSQSVNGQPDFLDVVFSTFEKLRNVPVPIIAAVNGPAIAGGLELILTCDIVIASEQATFADGHAKYGIIPGGGSSAILPRLLPVNVARYLLLTGEALPATTMHQLGLVNQIVETERLESAALDLAKAVAEKSPLVLAQMKRLVAKAQSISLRDAVIDEFLSLRNHTRSVDLHEGLAAFAEKRQPVFVGR